MHHYEAIFHLDSENAVVDPATKTVRTDNPDAANVTVVPSTGDGLSGDDRLILPRSGGH